MSLNLTDTFIDELYELSRRSFLSSDIQHVKNFLLDYLGVTFAGSYMIRKKGYKLINLLKSEGECPVIGFNKKSSAQSAVFINGLSAHVAELDDGVISGSVHPGSPLFSALLTMSESEKVSAEQLIIGTIVGYEAIVRLANTIQPSHKKKGYHASATCGAVGTAIGLSIMLGLTKKQIKNAFSSAVVSASGTLKAIEDNSELKPFNVGNAALTGYMAVIMARAGFEGPENPLQGDRGFLRIMSDDFDVSELFKGKGEPLAIDRVYIKPYAACRYCHPAIDACFSIRNKYKIKLNHIKEISVNTYQLAVHNHDHKKIDNVSSAKMSIPFSVAVALKTGKAGISEFSEENIIDPELTELTKKVSVISSEEFTSNFPHKSISSVEVITTDDKLFCEKIEYPKGEPENPLNEKELTRKFEMLMSFAGKGRDEIEEISDIILNLETNLKNLYPTL